MLLGMCGCASLVAQHMYICRCRRDVERFDECRYWCPSQSRVEIREPIIIQNHDLMRAVDVRGSQNSWEFVERLKNLLQVLATPPQLYRAGTPLNGT